MRQLSKSKVMAFRQCAKRLWLEIHHPEWRDDSPASQARFDEGNAVGDIARKLYDPGGMGSTLDPHQEGWTEAFVRTAQLLQTRAPVFEAAFSTTGALALADVLLPAGGTPRQRAWRMIEVKSSTSVKDTHRDDLAFQAFVAQAGGAHLVAVHLAHIDSSWVYPGNGDHTGLLTEVDLTEEALARGEEVQAWVDEAQSVARRRTEPALRTGRHCSAPYDCGFMDHCSSQEQQPEFPVHWLPRIQSRALKAHIETLKTQDLREVPDALLNTMQLRVKKHTLLGTPFFDAAGATAQLQDLRAHRAPAYFLDFETVNFAIPRWAKTRPYQQIPFQFSCHHLGPRGTLRHAEFLDLSGDDPSKDLAVALITACGTKGPVFAYSAGFEKARIRELAERFRGMRFQLMALSDRIVDLLPVAQAHYYHPSQQGSWSIKKVLPALVPHLRYDALDGVQDGGQAVEAYLEAIDPGTSQDRRHALDDQLRRYCQLDTLAMVRLWEMFLQRPPVALPGPKASTLAH